MTPEKIQRLASKVGAAKTYSNDRRFSEEQLAAFVREIAVELLTPVRDGLRRLDPIWCKLHEVEQITDAEFDDLLSTVEKIVDPEVA